MSDDQLLHLLVQLLLLVAIARLGGEVAVRLRLPEVVGEIVFGLALGPSILGAAWPEAHRFLFPADAVQRGALEALAWIGVLFLVAISGLETPLRLIRDSGRAALLSATFGFLVPFVCGVAVGLAAPADFMGPEAGHQLFAVFLGIALSISAIPVVSRLLLDLDAFGSRPGAVIISAAVAGDTVGWIITGVVSGIVSGAGTPLSNGIRAVIGTAVFLALAFTVGRGMVRLAVWTAARARIPFGETTVLLSIVVAGGIITQSLGVHAVLGAFVGGLLLRYARGRERTIESIRRIGMGYFVPLFFAYTGARVDLSALRGPVLVVALGVLVVAAASKLLGGWLGGALGGLSPWESVAVGAGLNARGAMELVIASLGLSLGILTSAAYATLVLIAVATSMMAGPMLRVSLSRAGALTVPRDRERRPLPAMSEDPSVRT